jgi:hypothetical protein
LSGAFTRLDLSSILGCDAPVRPTTTHPIRTSPVRRLTWRD